MRLQPRSRGQTARILWSRRKCRTRRGRAGAQLRGLWLFCRRYRQLWYGSGGLGFGWVGTLGRVRVKTLGADSIWQCGEKPAPAQHALLNKFFVNGRGGGFCPGVPFVVAKEAGCNDVVAGMLPPARLRSQMLRSALQKAGFFRTDLMCSGKGR